MTMAQDGGKVVSLMHRPPLPPGNSPGTHFCWRLSWPQSHGAIRRILCQWKIPVTPAWIEPATFWFVAQRLNHCATAVGFHVRQGIFVRSWPHVSFWRRTLFSGLTWQHWNTAFMLCVCVRVCTRARVRACARARICVCVCACMTACDSQLSWNCGSSVWAPKIWTCVFHRWKMCSLLTFTGVSDHKLLFKL